MGPAQLAERMLPAPVVHGLNPGSGNCRVAVLAERLLPVQVVRGSNPGSGNFTF